ncbi:hypothetical protein H5410_048568 [Solanum commersonii]|uniref:Uncharacterized protein n=1 Tax=Solanum commersonii TaxID=4109 RepID=A0A9J5XM45_SOLCO|nr:hypothetical protein H5410_048568 [Solanum commersonii]
MLFLKGSIGKNVSSAYNVTGEVDDSVKSSTCTNSSDARGGHIRADEEFKTQSQLDSCALTREQYAQILQLLEKKLEVPHCVNATDSSDNNLTPHFYQNTLVDVVSQEQEENCEVDVHEEGQIEPVPQTGVRKSGRGTKLPLWMKDFVSLNIHEGPYSLDKHADSNDMPTLVLYHIPLSSGQQL